ncbi:hypothetical protein BZA77DRAFT_313530 [Pyronema omphalodes]|nr:hypothetical protein BZA77DRAFT_313530 [Pyronema omphalodes]
MSVKLPPLVDNQSGYASIADVINKQSGVVAIKGVVSDSFPAKPTIKGDQMVTFTVQDHEHNKIKVRFFVTLEAMLPKVSPGDLVILAGLRVGRFNGSPILINEKDRTRFIIKPKSTNGAISAYQKFPVNMAITQQDLTAISNLQKWITDTGKTGPPVSSQNTVHAIAKTSARSFAFVKDMQFDRFYDMAGRILKIFNADHCFTIYVTDYTSNDKLFKYDPEELETLGKLQAGQHILQVSLWDINAHIARKKLQEGQYVYLQNMRFKRNRDGNGEGSLNGDRKYPDKCTFSVIEEGEKDPRVRAILQRERELEMKNGPKKKAAEPEVGEWEEGLEEPGEGGNPRVRCARMQMPICSLGFIKQGNHLKGEPYINRRYHVFCKVVNFRPQIEDFTGLFEEVREDGEVSVKPKQEWQWNFALLVIGRDGTQLTVRVDNKGGQCLFQEDACDLRKNPEALEKLREKLLILCGNTGKNKLRLGKRKNEQQDQPKAKRRKQNKAKAQSESEDDEDEDTPNMEPQFFDACLAEIGVQKDDGSIKRVWKLCDTTIS